MFFINPESKSIILDLNVTFDSVKAFLAPRGARALFVFWLKVAGSQPLFGLYFSHNCFKRT